MQQLISNFNYSIKNRTLFITGCSRKKGIGCALAIQAIKKEAKKIYVTAREISQLDDLVELYPEHIVPIELDITDYAQIKEVTNEARDVEVLINNAGWAGNSGCFYNYDEAVAKAEMDINYFGPMRLINEFAPHLLRNSNSAIVNIISIGAFTPAPMHITYSAAKAALYSVTGALRLELRASGMPVFGVYPGPIDTDMAANFDAVKESPENVAQRVFDGMENGLLDITVDALSNLFIDKLKPDIELIKKLKAHYGC